MTPLEAANAIYSKFRDTFTAAPYVFDNERFDMSVPESVHVRVMHLDSAQHTLGGAGQRKFRRYGRVRMHVRTPVDRGTARAYDLAHQVRAIFEGTSLGDIDFNDAQLQEIEEIPDTKRFTVRVDCYFDYDEIK